jgi:hypothetical protein
MICDSIWNWEVINVSIIVWNTIRNLYDTDIYGTCVIIKSFIFTNEFWQVYNFHINVGSLLVKIIHWCSREIND